MSVAERIGRQVLPIAVFIVSIGFLVYYNYISRTTFMDPFGAAFFSGLIAPGVQFISALLFSPRRRKIPIMIIDASIIIIAFLIAYYGDYVVCYVLNYPTISYLAEPGPQINTTVTIVAGAIVTFLAFWPTSKSASAKRE